MKTMVSVTIAASLLLGLTAPMPASAMPSVEDPMDPCFDTSSGYLSRSGSSWSYAGSSDNWNWFQTNTLVRKSDQLFRAQVYSGQLFRYQETSQGAQNYSINYDLGAQTKTVVMQEMTPGSYFSEFLIETVVGWLLDDQGNKLQRTNFTSRSRTSSSTGEWLSPSTHFISRDCSSRTGGAGPGGGSGNARVTAEVFSFDIIAGTNQTFQVQAYSGMGSSFASVSTNSGALAEGDRLLVMNDPFSTDNEFGFSSLGFAAVDRNGARIQINQPLTVTYQESPAGNLAFSKDGKDWVELDSAGESGSPVRPLGVSSFSVTSLPLDGWLFVGQKKQQKAPIIYANRFNTPVGSKVLFATTSGSGKGNVVFESKTPSTCSVTGANEVIASAPGTCRVLAAKMGFDGYLDAKSQLIRLQIVE